VITSIIVNKKLILQLNYHVGSKLIKELTTSYFA
jgi:hypothetical protein